MSRKRKKEKSKARTYKRCVKRYSVRINQVKWKMLLELLKLYAREKDYFLCQYPRLGNMYACYSFRAIRNRMVNKEYQSVFGLQARQWKLALKDALETVDRYWASLCAKWRESICQSEHLSKEEKQYLLEAISSRKKLYAVLLSRCRKFLKTSLNLKQRKRCRRFLEKLITGTVKKAPRVQIVRSFLAEPETYRVFEYKGRQYIAIMSKESGKRIVIPLTGMGKIEGQIRIVFDFEKQRIEVHQAMESPVKCLAKVEKIGIDLGITEVFTDSDSHRFGKRFGKTISKYSDAQKSKGQKRNKLHSLVKKLKAKGNLRKARKIQNNNLRRKKLERKLVRRRKELERQVNQAFNRFFDEKAPQKVVYENLSHMTGKAKSKRLSRLVSAWIRRIISDRLEFKASERGSLLKAVNCAHSSRVCPRCYWTHKGNRSGDTFRCQFCGYIAASDHTAAVEILRRDDDPDIFLWTHRNQVHSILIARFRRRLESWNFELHPSSQLCWESVREELGDKVVDAFLLKLCEDAKEVLATVPGKTPDTSSTASLSHSGRERRSRKKKSLGERNSSSSILSGDNSADDGPDTKTQI